MRLTDEQIMEVWRDSQHGVTVDVGAFVRKCLALAALPDEPKPYEDRERRGWEVSQPGALK